MKVKIYQRFSMNTNLWLAVLLTIYMNSVVDSE